MPHTILHWNGFDTGSGLDSDYDPTEFNGSSTSYVSGPFSGINTYYGYGRMLGVSGASLRLVPRLPGSAYLAAAAQMLICISSGGLGEQTIMRFWDSLAGAEQISIRIVWNSGTSMYDLRVYRGGTLLSTIAGFAGAAQWGWLSAMVYVHPTAGKISIRTGFNDAISYSFSGNTQNTANQKIDFVEVGILGGSHSWTMDDLVISSCLPSDDAMRRIRIMGAEVPTGNDMTNFLPVGAAQNWQAVNEVPPNNDTSYVWSSAPGSQDTYNRNWPSVSQTILGVGVSCRARKEEAGAGAIATVVKRFSSSYSSPNFFVTSNYFSARHTWFTDPLTGASWTPSALNTNLKFGFRIP